MTMLHHFTSTTAGLSVTWTNGTETLFPWFWLRDHGEDAISLDQTTQQRKIDTFAIDPAIRAQRVILSPDQRYLDLDWPEHTQSLISVARLADCAGLIEAPLRSLWQAGSLPDPLPQIDYAEIAAGDVGVRDWLQLIQRWGFALIHNTRASEDGTRQLAEHIAPAQHTIFGSYWKLAAELREHADTAYSTQYLAPHTDATYYHDAPGLQLFNCLEFEGSGGESVLVDGFAIARTLQQQSPEHYAVLSQVEVPGQYLDNGVNLQTERPVLRHDRKGRLLQVSFNNYDRAPFLLPPADMAAFYAAYSAFNRHVLDQRNWLKIPLRPGMALILDNWRCLHGRMGYTGKRVFYGCYHNRADYDSRLRTLTNP